MGRKSRAKRERGPVVLPEPPTRWYHPVLFGAALLAALVSLRFLIAIPALIADPGGIPEALLVIATAAAAGAAGGLVYALVGTRLRRVRPGGRYLAGIVTMAGYLGALLFLVPRVDPSMAREFSGPFAWIAVLAASVLFGILVGRSWFGDPPATPPPSHPTS